MEWLSKLCFVFFPGTLGIFLYSKIRYTLNYNANFKKKTFFLEEYEDFYFWHEDFMIYKLLFER